MLFLTFVYFLSFSLTLRWDLYVIFNNYVFLFVSLTIEVGFMCYIQQSRVSFRFAHH